MRKWTENELTYLPLRNIPPLHRTTPLEIKNCLASPKNPIFQNYALCAPTYETSIHVFKELNQIVRFK